MYGTGAHTDELGTAGDVAVAQTPMNGEAASVSESRWFRQEVCVSDGNNRVMCIIDYTGFLIRYRTGGDESEPSSKIRVGVAGN